MKRRRTTQRFTPRAPNAAFVAAMPVALIVIVLPVTVILPARGVHLPPWVPLAAIFLILLVMVAHLFRVYFFTRRIAASDGFLCLNCHYDFHGLPDRGDCPECGEPYDRDTLERRWNAWLLSQTKYKKTIRPRR